MIRIRNLCNGFGSEVSISLPVAHGLAAPKEILVDQRQMSGLSGELGDSGGRNLLNCCWTLA